MWSDTAFEEINEAKASMDDIYDKPDPRAYFRELEKCCYAIPSAAKPIFQNLLSHIQGKQEDAVRILDIGCSYGINAALLKYDLTMADLYEYSSQQSLPNMSPTEVAKDYKEFFANIDDAAEIEMIGLDQAENAIDFAEKVGLLEEALTVNLETEPLPESTKENLAGVDMVMSTGCVGYVTEKTFDRLLPVITQNGAPWMAHFVLRMFPFDAIEDALGNWGYKTEKLEDRTFVQRRFTSDDEQEQILEQLREQGIDPTDLETEGNLLAEFYLSRPVKEANELPLEQLLAA